MNIQSLPKVLLHEHLDGDLRVQTLFELMQQQRVPSPAADVPALDRWFQARAHAGSLVEFLRGFALTVAAMGSPAAMRRVADAYPDDHDAAVFWVDAWMNTTPWDYCCESSDTRTANSLLVEVRDAADLSAAAGWLRGHPSSTPPGWRWPPRCVAAGERWPSPRGRGWWPGAVRGRE